MHKACGYSWICVDFEGKKRHGEYYHAEDDTEDVAERFLHSIIEYSTILEKEIDEYQSIAPGKLEEVVTPSQL